MLRHAAILTCLLALGVVGCGYSRAPVPSLVTPAPPQGFHALSFPAAGLTLEAPRSWITIDNRPPQLVTVTSGDAVIAVWRYVRILPLPRGHAAMATARRALIAAVEARQPGVQVIRARIVHLGGARGIELNALEHVKGQLRRVRSTHLYSGQQEIVLEVYAPAGLFHSVDHLVFSPLRRSLRITATS